MFHTMTTTNLAYFSLTATSGLDDLEYTAVNVYDNRKIVLVTFKATNASVTITSSQAGKLGYVLRKIGHTD